jgi:hypothetical protein
MYFAHPTPEQLGSALEAWQWLPIEGKRPILVTAFADVFFDSADGIWFLDTIEGKLKRTCSSREELDQILGTDEGKDLYLLSGFVDRAQSEGKTLSQHQCYDFRRPPVLGGAIDYSNIEKMDLSVALDIRGQIHDQVRTFKPGTKISKITIDQGRWNKTSKS